MRYSAHIKKVTIAIFAMLVPVLGNADVKMPGIFGDHMVLQQGQKIPVWNEAAAAPVAVRYAWADFPVCSLYNREGLPAYPFRTDSWK